MKNLKGTIIVVIVMTLFIGTVALGAAGPKVYRGELVNPMLLAYASTSGQGGNSGRIWDAEGNLEGLGTVHVLVRASWDWSAYRGTPTAADNTRHPSAVVNSTPIKFDGCRAGPVCAAPVPEFIDGHAGLIIDTTKSPVTFPAEHDLTYANGKVRHGHPNPFVADATVTITTKNGDEIWGAITGGSVTEIKVPGTGGGGSINEWFIGFEITDGTGKFAGATGSGSVHMVFDSGSAHTDDASIYQNNPARFVEHSIALRLD